MTQKIIIRQLISEVLRNIAWLELEFEMEFPPVPQMAIGISPGNSVLIEEIVYEIKNKRYICYPAEYRILRDGCTFDEVVKEYMDMGFHYEAKKR